MAENARSAVIPEELPAWVRTTKPLPDGHQIAWVAAGLRRAEAEVGVALPVSYSQAVATGGLARRTSWG